MKFLFHSHLALDYPGTIKDLRRRYPQHEFAVADGHAELVAEIRDTEVLIDYRMTPELLDAAVQLRWLFVPFTGVNMVPFSLLANRNVGVCNNHGNSELVAERALALALALMGRVAEFDRGMRRGHWFRNESPEQPFQFWESMRGKQVLILGTGAIGQGIAELLTPFGCRICGWRRRQGGVRPAGFTSLAPSLQSGLAEADLVFIALPLTDDTRGLIGSEELALMRGAWLVNVARGEIVIEEALYRALANRELAGAALDVWYRYPEPFHADSLPSEFAFHELENLVMSPHAGSHAPEGKGGQLAGTVENIVSLIETGWPLDVVSPESGY